MSCHIWNFVCFLTSHTMSEQRLKYILMSELGLVTLCHYENITFIQTDTLK
ncbi:hypothetical protein Leryth_016991 [Lithospermum erythrorhizon]|nr:hypothetical protein Leryth_016991 [Lithospermum erythrorhizon]